MYKQQFETIDDLKAAIQKKISIIKPTILESVITNSNNRLDKIIEKQESHCENSTANFESCTFTLSHVNNCEINLTQVSNNKNH